ncbi:AMP-binding protein [Natronomonas amylolytica]|uniref:AMP-binding protein n=1 Tax=Natronomonas amylolytica TaxID=3108498 RepID=UPI0030080823
MPDEPPWYAEYEAFGIDRSLEPYPDHLLHQFLYEAADQYPEQGIVQSGRHVSYGELREDADALAAALQERGVGEGDRVATVLPTSAQFVVATHAISRAGGVHIPNDFLDADEDLVYRLERGDPDVLIGQDDHRELLERLRGAADIDHLVLTDLDDYAEDAPKHDSEKGVEWWPAVLESAGDPEPVDIDPDDTHTLLFTGGTTGKPKGCLLSHRNLVANATQAIAAQSRLPDLMRGRESAVLALPAYHSYGYTIANMLVSLGLDLLVVPDARDTELIREHIAEYGPLVMFGVPTQFMEIADEELDGDVIGLSGSAPLAEETRERFSEQSTGMSQGYGLSEMSPITHFNVAGIQEAVMGDAAAEDTGYDRPTIGVPVPDTEVKLRDVDTDEEIPLAEAASEEREGEMLVDGPQRMTGYLDADDPFDEEGFVATGDVVKVDEKGRFYVVDRVKNMINVSGLKVYAEEVDEELYGMDGVRRPATVGVPDPERPGSERVKIFVEAEDGAEITAADVRSYLDGRVPRQAMPEAVEFVAEIPLTDIGKTDREALKNRED